MDITTLAIPDLLGRAENAGDQEIGFHQVIAAFYESIEALELNLTDATTAGGALVKAATAVAQAELLGSEIPTQGANLTDANASVSISGGAQRVLPSATLTTDRVLTLAVSGSPAAGEMMVILRRDATAHTLTVEDDAAAELFVFPASTRMAGYFRFDGDTGHWTLSGAIRIQ